MLHDPESWDDPDEFKPERFLDEGGQLNSKATQVYAFGIGKNKQWDATYCRFGKVDVT